MFKDFDLLDRVKWYFDTVASFGSFIIAVEATGAYLFAMKMDREQILVQASELMEKLALDRKEMVIVMVDPGAESGGPGFFDFGVRNAFTDLVVEVRPDDFEDVVRRMTGSRPAVFDREDVASIAGCFSSMIKYGTQVESYLSEFSLDKKTEELLLQTFPDSVEDVILCGAPSETAQEVFEKICEHNRVKNEKEEKPVKLLAVADKRANDMLSASFVFAASGMFAIIFDLGLPAVIFGAAGFWFAGSLALMYRTFWSVMAKAFNICVLIAGMAYFACRFVPRILEVVEKMNYVIGG